MFLYERAYDTVGTSLVDVSVEVVTQTEMDITSLPEN